MSIFQVKIAGLKELQRELKELPEKIIQGVDDEIEASMQNMKLNAQNAAPVDQGTLKREITYYREKPLRWVFVSQSLYSAYVEFGTRSNVQIPAGFNIQVTKTQSSLSAKEAIFNWCKRNGIEKRLWFPIFIKIMTKGIKPHPFFYPAFVKEVPVLERNVKSRIESLKL